MMKGFVFYLFAIALITPSRIYSQEPVKETLTITTYYPSPYGVFQDLLISRGQAIGDTNGDGSVDNNDLPRDASGNPSAGFLVNTGVYFLGGNGDTNGDGTFAPNDVLRIINYLKGTSSLTPAEAARADIDGSGSVTALDARLLVDILNGVRTLEEARAFGKTYYHNLLTPAGALDLSGDDWSLLNINAEGVGIGLGNNIPQAKLDVNGEIKIGMSSPTPLACSSTTAGVLRYNNKNNKIEYCDGLTDWKSVFPSPIATGSYTGDNVNGRTIALPFTPKFIAIYAAPYSSENPVQFYKTDTMPGRCAFFQGGLAAWNGYRDLIEIVPNGFKVYAQTVSCCSVSPGCNTQYGKSANLSGATYYYAAWQ